MATRTLTDEDKDVICGMIRKRQPCAYAKAIMWALGIIVALSTVFGVLFMSLNAKVAASEKITQENKTDVKWIRETLQEMRDDIKEVKREVRNANP